MKFIYSITLLCTSFAAVSNAIAGQSQCRPDCHGKNVPCHAEEVPCYVKLEPCHQSHDPCHAKYRRQLEQQIPGGNTGGTGSFPGDNTGGTGSFPGDNTGGTGSFPGDNTGGTGSFPGGNTGTGSFPDIFGDLLPSGNTGGTGSTPGNNNTPINNNNNGSGQQPSSAAQSIPASIFDNLPGFLGISFPGQPQPTPTGAAANSLPNQLVSSPNTLNQDQGQNPNNQNDQNELGQQTDTGDINNNDDQEETVENIKTVDSHTGAATTVDNNGMFAGFVAVVAAAIWAF
ncbi:hypothetical protein LPJ66_002311 [Kickxella alabastrina]|uniref:Uncharacterized protein n=1 Tax=Kickxella alabastrina TaxID=61397 RepID=A0ACC1IQR7_9FUNG|nr:hypothetical protein LPJ66_002311 [Kickxella alabastrina]